MSNLVEPFVVRASYGDAGHTVEYAIDTYTTPFSVVLVHFAYGAGVAAPPPGYELVVVSEFLGRKYAFGAESRCIVAKPSDMFPAMGPRDNERLACVVLQPSEETEDGQEPSFLRAGIKLLAADDLGRLMFAKKDCAWFEDADALLPV